MVATIEKLPRQTINRKVQLFVVKINGNEVGVIEKLLRPKAFEARFLHSGIALGVFTSKQDAAVAIVKAHRLITA